VVSQVKLRSSVASEKLSPTNNSILKILERDNFKIEDGVDSAEVSAFVSWIESAEQSDQ
jgi:hypothetical protein